MSRFRICSRSGSEQPGSFEFVTSIPDMLISWGDLARVVLKEYQEVLCVVERYGFGLFRTVAAARFAGEAGFRLR
jgi:hypothetical protein